MPSAAINSTALPYTNLLQRAARSRTGTRRKFNRRPGTGGAAAMSTMILGNGACLFTVMDYSTRFVLSCMVSPIKMGAEPPEIFRGRAKGGRDPVGVRDRRPGCLFWDGQKGALAQGRTPPGARHLGAHEKRVQPQRRAQEPERAFQAAHPQAAATRWRIR